MAKTSNVLLVGGAAVALYLLYKSTTAAAKAVGAGYNASVNTVSDALTSLFGPAVTIAGTMYVVTFPDGSRHAVDASTVDASGNFSWSGYPAGSQAAQQLQIMVGSDGTKYAVSGS